MLLSKAQIDLINKLGREGIDRDQLSPDECAIACQLSEMNAVILRWKGLKDQKYAATEAGARAAKQPVIAANGGWGWWAGSSEEWFTVGPLASRDEAIREATAIRLGEDNSPGKHAHTLYLIEARQDPVDLSAWIDIDSMVEALHERLGDDLGGEDGESPADGAWDDAQHTDLEASIKAAVAAWQARHAIVVTPRQFTDSRNTECVRGPVNPPAEAVAAE